MTRRVLTVLAVLALALAAIYLTRTFWLAKLGDALVYQDGPVKADVAVVLAGDPDGHRIEKAAELIRAGYVPAAIIDGPSGVYGFYESSLAILYITRQGYPQSWFIGFPMQAKSTVEEAHAVLAELRRRQVRSFLLVTSDFHTARARRIFLKAEREMNYQPEIRTVASRSEYFSPNGWWHTREGCKIAALEWEKTLGSAVGL